jgi:hypothetical protein
MTRLAPDGDGTPPSVNDLPLLQSRARTVFYLTARLIDARPKASALPDLLAFAVGAR